MKKLLAIISAGVAVIAATILVPSSSPTPTTTNETFAPRTAGACTADDSTLLSTYLSARSGTSVTLGHDQCYTIDTTLKIQSTINLTIHGNGATLMQSSDPGSKIPILDLWENTNLKIDHLTIDGAYNGSNGGPGEEGHYGVRMEGDNGVLMRNDTIENTQGDWVYLSPPYDLHDSDELNTGITMTHDTFVNAGYHGFTDESSGCWTLAPCNGFTLSLSTMTNAAVDGMDFEYDIFNTAFNANGTPFFAAQDWVTVSNNTWNGWGDDWFASIQGQTFQLPQTSTYAGATHTVSFVEASNLLLADPVPDGYHLTGSGTIMTSGGLRSFTYTSYSGSTLGTVAISGPGSATVANGAAVKYGNECPAGYGYSANGCGGVQEQHLNLVNNTLLTNGPLFEVVGTNPFLTPLPYQNAFWTIKNNHFAPGAYSGPYRGGLSAAGQLYSIRSLNITGNTYPLCAGEFENPEPAFACGSPNEYIFDLDAIIGGSIKNNDFTGALGCVGVNCITTGPIQPQTYNTAVSMTMCNNKYGYRGTSLDATC